MLRGRRSISRSTATLLSFVAGMLLCAVPAALHRVQGQSEFTDSSTLPYHPVKRGRGGSGPIVGSLFESVAAPFWQVGGGPEVAVAEVIGLLHTEGKAKGAGCSALVRAVRLLLLSVWLQVFGGSQRSASPRIQRVRRARELPGVGRVNIVTVYDGAGVVVLVSHLCQVRLAVC